MYLLEAYLYAKELLEVLGNLRKRMTVKIHFQSEGNRFLRLSHSRELAVIVESVLTLVALVELLPVVLTSLDNLIRSTPLTLPSPVKRLFSGIVYTLYTGSVGHFNRLPSPVGVFALAGL